MKEDTNVFRSLSLLPEFESKIDKISKHVLSHHSIKPFNLKFLPESDHQYAQRNQICQVFVDSNANHVNTALLAKLREYFNDSKILHTYDNEKLMYVYAIANDDFIKKSKYTEEVNRKRLRYRVLSIIILICMLVWVFSKLAPGSDEESDL